MLLKSLFFAAAAALAANAQSTTTTSAATIPSGISQCVIACSTQAAEAGSCSSFTDLTCVCTSSAFQTAAAACLQANCTASDVAEAQALQQSECATISNTTTTTSSATSSSTTSSAAKTSTAASSGAATGLVPSLALDSAFGGLVALAGALVGAGLVM